jgi:CRISPR-associated protein Cas2
MRHVYLVTYDIRQDKRLRRVFKVMRGFGQHLQYSVSRCELSAANRARLTARLSDVIDQRADQVLIFDLGPSDGYRADLVETLGQAYVPDEGDAVVV